MSINTAHANGGVLIHAGEFILIFVDDVELKFDGCSDRRMKGNKKGRLFLTTHRMIFNNSDKCDMLQSFNFPFFLMSDVEMEQPAFGCNYIKGKVRSVPQADLHMDPWRGLALFRLYFKKGGAIDFGMAMLQAAKLASVHTTREPPPPYVPPIPPFNTANPQYYMPPPDYFGVAVPSHVFPNAPPANAVFMTEQPPPYPGVNTRPNDYGRPAPSVPVFYPGQNRPPAVQEPRPTAALCAGSDAKAAEAAQSAYYDPNNPHRAYMPQQPPSYYQAPPSYDEATRKQQ